MNYKGIAGLVLTLLLLAGGVFFGPDFKDSVCGPKAAEVK